MLLLSRHGSSCRFSRFRSARAEAEHGAGRRGERLAAFPLALVLLFFDTLSRVLLLAYAAAILRVIGIVRAKELLARCLRGEPLDLAPLLREPLVVPSTMPVMRLLETFRMSDVKVAVVLDEYGSLEGLVTMNDILEELVTDVPGRLDADEPDIVQRDDGGWLVDGAIAVDDLLAEFGAEVLTVPERCGHRTVGGLVMAMLGHVPKIGEHFEWSGLRLEVVDLDGRRIDRVLGTPVDNGRRGGETRRDEPGSLGPERADGSSP